MVVAQVLAKRIIVVDDTEVVRETVQAYLVREGFDVRTASGGEELRRLLIERPTDLVVLDLQMPDEDGLSITRFLRASYDCGIIMLTGKTDVTDKIVALELGADDYLCKPHEPRELLARVRTVLRRLDTSTRSTPAESTRTDHAWTFDMDARALAGRDGVTAALTTAEYKLLVALVEKPGRVLTREQLLNVVYERPWDYFDRSIDVLVTRLRRKIESVDPGADNIKSVRGAGYVFSRSRVTADASH